MSLLHFKNVYSVNFRSIIWSKLCIYFENGIFLSGNRIAGINKGNIHLFRIFWDKMATNQYGYVKTNQIKAHDDKITFIKAVESGSVVITMSADSTIKGFFTNKMTQFLNFDKTKYSIIKISILDKNHVTSIEHLR